MEQLNPQQLEAVRHMEGPLLVLAGAGSGKTRVVTCRIAHLLEQGILPSDILAVTFTNKAADEMRLRIRTQKNAQVLACTFHSLGARILRESIAELGYRSDFVIYDAEDSEKLLKNCLASLGSQENGIVKKMRLQISSAKNSLQGPQNDATDRLFAQAYSLYQERLRSCNAVDFDDLLYLPCRLFQEHENIRKEYQNRWLFLLIDEYQDTNEAQHLLATFLVEEHQNLFAVGDPDQSIYSWRGARYQNILQFEKDFPGAKVVALDQNYRSTNIILQAANHLISHNEARYEKKLWSELGDGEKVGLCVVQSEREEAEFVARRLMDIVHREHVSYNDIAIFYRTNAQSRTFEDALLMRRIPHRIIGGLSFYERREIKDILAYLRMIVSNDDLISFLRTVPLPKRGLGATILEKISAAAQESCLPIFSFCERLVEEVAPASVKLNVKQKEGLHSYVSLIHRLRACRGSCKLSELVAETMEKSHYIKVLQEDPESQEDRKENLEELIGKTVEWEDGQDAPSLDRFLEELSLRSNVDKGDGGAAVNLMTLHNSKGLEFPVVFLVGMEEELFPHINSQECLESLEEERRLCYVGMTRAKRHLCLTASRYRYMWGGARLMRPSRFLQEIPVQYVKNFSPIGYEPRKVVEQINADPEIFPSGQRVRHREFGLGTVRKAYHTSAGLTYDVYFDTCQAVRSLAAKYAKLQPVP